MRSIDHFRLEPYRFLFAIGLVHLVWGVSLWIAFGLGVAPYPGPDHARFMIEGFLISFSMGFLMTAIPRFSRSKPASWPEAVTASITAVLAGLSDPFALAAMAFLVLFGMRRMLSSASKGKAPTFFVFIQGGMFFGLAGLITKCFFPDHFFAFKTWLYEGMMMLWLCGIGSRVLVMLLSPGSAPLSKREVYSVFAVLVAGIAVQPLGPDAYRAGDFLRAVGILYLSWRVWRVQNPPFRRGHLAWGVWIGIVFLNLGQITRLAFPSFGIHAAHLIFIGGYCTLAMMVAIRVSIAHSGESLETEKKLKRVSAAALLFALAALTRFSVAVLKPELYTDHLVYAALTVLAAVPIWASIVLPRLSRDESHEHDGVTP